MRLSHEGVTSVEASAYAYLRVDVLPAATQPPIRQQFKRMLDARLAAHEHRNDPAQADRDLAIMARAPEQIWAMSVVASDGSATASLLVIPPLNTMIDLATSRRVALQYQLPGLVVSLLIGASILSGLLAGYAMSKRMRRSWFHVVAYALLPAMTIYSVLDLDQARAGLINIDVSYRPLYDLRQAIR